MIFAEEDLNSLNAIAGLLASFGCDSQAGCVLSTMATFDVHTFHTSISFNDKNKEPQISPRLSCILAISASQSNSDTLQ